MVGRSFTWSKNITFPDLLYLEWTSGHSACISSVPYENTKRKRKNNGILTLTHQLWQDGIKPEKVNTVIHVFILQDHFQVVWGVINSWKLTGHDDFPDGRSKLISQRGVKLSSADINYERNRWGFKISGSRQEIYVVLGGWGVRGGEGSVRDGWWVVEKTNETNSRKNASSSLKDNIVSHNSRQWESCAVEPYFSALYWWSHHPESKAWPFLLRHLGEVVISRHRGARSCRGQGKDGCPACACGCVCAFESVIPW